jgi:hypothetical protein
MIGTNLGFVFKVAIVEKTYCMTSNGHQVNFPTTTTHQKSSRTDSNCCCVLEVGLLNI